MIGDLPKVDLKVEMLTSDPRLMAWARVYWAAHYAGQTRLKYEITVQELHTQAVNTIGEIPEIELLARVTLFNCSQCGGPIVLRHRSDLQQRIRHSNWMCDACVDVTRQREQDEQEKIRRLKADAAAAATAKRREAIRAAWHRPMKPLTLDNLSLQDAVYLLAAWRASVSERLDSMPPLCELAEPISPDEGFTVKIIRHLHARKLVWVDPESPIEAFKSDLTSCDTFRVGWLISPIEAATGERTLIDAIEDQFLTGQMPDRWKPEVIGLWREIARYEALQYLHVQMDEHRLDFTAGDKTNLVIDDCLNNYSVAQLYNMIYRAVRNAAAFYMTGAVYKQHAANTVVGRIRSSAEKFRAEGWDMKNYRRDFRCAPTAISKVLFEAALQIGDDGFNCVPKSFET